MSFQTWNPAQPNGYGYNFNAEGWAIGLGGSSGDFYRAAGTGTPVLGQLFNRADFSALSGATISPGATLSFTLYTLLLQPNTALGTPVGFKTYVEFTHGGSTIEGWTSDSFRVNATASTVASSGSLIGVGLKNIDRTPGPVGAPEPGSLALAGVGAVAAAARRRWLRSANRV